jgi:hypothetical protein
MDKKTILAGIVKVNGSTTEIKWKEVFFRAEQLSNFQDALISQYPHLSNLNATAIILKNRLEIAENEGLLFFMEGVHGVGSEDGNFRDQQKFIRFLKEVQHYTKIGEATGWNFEKIKTEVFYGYTNKTNNLQKTG